MNSSTEKKILKLIHSKRDGTSGFGANDVNEIFNAISEQHKDYIKTIFNIIFGYPNSEIDIFVWCCALCCMLKELESRFFITKGLTEFFSASSYAGGLVDDVLGIDFARNIREKYTEKSDCNDI